MVGIVFQLDASAAGCFIYRFLHAVCDVVCIHDYLAVHISGCTACRLGQRTVTAKEAFLVCIENSYERNFRQVESFS